MRDNQPLEENTKLKNLMSLYDESSRDGGNSRLDLAPIFSGLVPTASVFSDEELIAQGGMKSILKVFDPKTARYIALAKLKPDSPLELYEPFLREARLTALLDHPNIITILDIGLDADSTPWFTMELKTGDRLDHVIDRIHSTKKNQLDIESISYLLNIFMKICDAIDYAHNQNVIHLDLKPQNIQVGQHGEVIVCDWGLGKLIGHKDYDGGDFDRLLLNPDLLNNMTLSGCIKGSPGFISPEQISKSNETTFQTDIYALGSILYVLLTKQIPIKGNSTNDLLKNTEKGKIIPPEERCPNQTIPLGLSSVTQKALATDPACRYQSVKELKQDIESYLNGFSTQAENAGFFSEIKLFYLRQQKIINTFVLSLILLTVAIGWAFIAVNKSKNEAIAAKQESQRLGQEAAPSYYDKGLGALFSGSLDWARENFKIAALLDPSFIDARNHYACLLFMKGAHEKAQTSFHENPQSFYRSIWLLNEAYLEDSLTHEKEYEMVAKLLSDCSDIVQTPLTVALFMHWALDPREKYHQIALANFNFHPKICRSVLLYISRDPKNPRSKILLDKVLETLDNNPKSIHRRMTATLGAEISDNPTTIERFRSHIPQNLALGQPVEHTGGYRTDPQLTVDGIVSDNNYWSASPLPAQVEISLGKFMTISKIVVHTNKYFVPNKTEYIYTVLVRNTDDKWKIVGTNNDKLPNHNEGTKHPYEFSPQYTDRVRLKIDFNTGPIPIQIKEIEVY